MFGWKASVPAGGSLRQAELLSSWVSPGARGELSAAVPV